ISHRVVWCSVATVGPTGRPRSRVLHPYWEMTGGHVRGWAVTRPTPLKLAHLAHCPYVSCSYSNPSHDTPLPACAPPPQTHPPPANGNAAGNCSVPLRRRWATISPPPSPTAPTAAPPLSCNSIPGSCGSTPQPTLPPRAHPASGNPQHQPDHRPALTATPFGRRGSRFP